MAAIPSIVDVDGKFDCYTILNGVTQGIDSFHIKETYGDRLSVLDIENGKVTRCKIRGVMRNDPNECLVAFTVFLPSFPVPDSPSALRIYSGREIYQRIKVEAIYSGLTCALIFVLIKPGNVVSVFQGAAPMPIASLSYVSTETDDQSSVYHFMFSICYPFPIT